jgi:hypothetical protein
MPTTLGTRDSDNVTGRLGEVMQLLSLHGIKQRFISCTASRIATVLTELSYTHARTYTRVTLGVTEHAFSGSKHRLSFIPYLFTSLLIYYNFLCNTTYLENNF